MRPAIIGLLLVGLAVAEPQAEPTPPIDPDVQLQLSIDAKRREFHVGEIIRIKLSFSSRTRERYQVDQAQYDRSGRMNSERFDVSPMDGVVDPLAEYFADGLHVGGGLRGIEFLTAKPWTIQLNLNEWVRFTKPGEYRLKVSSDRVSVVDPKSASGTSAVTATSNEITLKILPADPEWEKQVFDEAVATLKSKSAANTADIDDSPARRAFETLRFLGTPEATRELVRQMRGERDRFDSTCFFGVIASPHRSVAREALEAALTDPDHPVGDNLLGALAFITRRDEPAAGDFERTENERRVLAKLVEALPNKRREAARVSLYTALDRAWVRGGVQLLSRETIQELVPQIIARFDELPAEQKETLLEWRWEAIKSPALLPLLKRYAQDERQTSALADKAVQRWYELDPASARPFIIKEITRAEPRFSGAALTILPDQTLAEVDDAFARHLTRNMLDASSAAARVVARYASGAVLPQVLKKLDQGIGTWGCQVQNAFLGYVLRVHPPSAKPRIEKAISKSGEVASGCYRELLSGVAAIHYHPLLEEIALERLSSADAEIASDAARVLGRFGSAAAEPALWHQFEQWSSRWKGRESELMSTDADALHPSDALRLGVELVNAIATGKAWLTDESDLRRLAAANEIPRLKAEVDHYLERWKERPLSISVLPCSSDFSASLVQYHVNSLNGLDERLAQFLRGTAFSLGDVSDEPTAPCVAEVRQRLRDHGMLVTEPKAR